MSTLYFADELLDGIKLQVQFIITLNIIDKFPEYFIFKIKWSL